jgi:hypothetical protein
MGSDLGYEATTGESYHVVPDLKLLTSKSPCEPDPKLQRNFTDPDSRVLLTKDGFIQGYNAQAAVDGAKQIIVAHGLTQSMSDCPLLVPLVDAVRAHLGRKPREISADAGYCSEDNLLALATRKIHAYVATGRAKHPAGTTRKVGGEMTQTMRQKLKRAGYRSRYRLRKQIVEPVFGQIKHARGFRQFLLRGLEAVQAEWALICTITSQSSPRRSEGAYLTGTKVSAPAGWPAGSHGSRSGLPRRSAATRAGLASSH